MTAVSRLFPIWCDWVKPQTNMISMFHLARIYKVDYVKGLHNTQIWYNVSPKYGTLVLMRLHNRYIHVIANLIYQCLHHKTIFLFMKSLLLLSYDNVRYWYKEIFIIFARYSMYTILYFCLWLWTSHVQVIYSINS